MVVRVRDPHRKTARAGVQWLVAAAVVLSAPLGVRTSN
jgi:hypothetical protein